MVENGNIDNVQTSAIRNPFIHVLNLLRKMLYCDSVRYISSFKIKDKKNTDLVYVYILIYYCYYNIYLINLSIIQSIT